MKITASTRRMVKIHPMSVSSTRRMSSILPKPVPGVVVEVIWAAATNGIAETATAAIIGKSFLVAFIVISYRNTRLALSAVFPAAVSREAPRRFLSGKPSMLSSISYFTVVHNRGVRRVGTGASTHELLGKRYYAPRHKCHHDPDQ